MKETVIIYWWFLLLAAVFPVSIAASSILYFPLLGFYILGGAWTFKKWPPQFGATEKAFLIFWLVSLISAFLGMNPWFSHVRLTKDLYFFIAVLVIAYLTQKNDATQLMRVFMLSAIITAIFGILQRLIGVDQSDNAGGYFHYLPAWLAHAPRSLQNHLSMVNGRVVGTRAHPLTYAEGLLFPFGYTLSRLARRQAGAWKWGLAQFIILLALIVSQSRGPWMAALAMVGACCALERHAYLYKRLICIYIPIALCFCAPSLRTRAQTITNTTYASNAERLEMWHAGRLMVQDHPLLGVGTGTMHEASPHYQSPARRLDGPWGHLHNMYINIAAERGLLGLAAFLIFIFILARELFHGYRMAGGDITENARVICLTAILSLLGWMVAGFTETIFHDSNVAMMFYFVMGIALATARKTLKNL